jgi:hypothetical protein
LVIGNPHGTHRGGVPVAITVIPAGCDEPRHRAKITRRSGIAGRGFRYSVGVAVDYCRQLDR